MERIVLRHLTGSKANQVEEFPLSHVKEILLGRDPSATVRYDPDRDDLVGRQHARIAQDANDPTVFTVTDLNSRNGTFVNRQRITGTTRIGPGDSVQLGPGGPELQFDLEPRPAGTVKTTRMAVSTNAPTLSGPHAPTVPTTRVAGAGPMPSGPPPPSGSAPSSGTGTVGKATVERMISHNIAETKKSQGRKYLLIGAAALIVVFVLFGAAGGFLYWRSRQVEQVAQGKVEEFKLEREKEKAESSVPPSLIVKNSGNAVVKLRVAWRLLSPNGGLVYHQYLPNPNGRLIPNGPPVLACFVQTTNGAIEPYLTYDGNPYSVGIGGGGEGSGFVVSGEGLILTNNHIAAAWKTRYDFPPIASVGIVFGADKRSIVRTISPAEAANLAWIPGDTQQELSGSFTGRNDRLEVVFPNTDGTLEARLERSSDRHDVALISIRAGDSAPKVELFDNYDKIQPGDQAVVLGYPAISPPVFGIIKSQNIFNTATQAKEIPDPTVSVGNIGKVIRGKEGSGGKGDVVSVVGDVYQLTINSTGAGNSGGPVFDDRGRVIGIFFASRRNETAAVTYAVPIKYGMELLSIGGGSK